MGVGLRIWVGGFRRIDLTIMPRVGVKVVKILCLCAEGLLKSLRDDIREKSFLAKLLIESYKRVHIDCLVCVMLEFKILYKIIIQCLYSYSR